MTSGSGYDISASVSESNASSVECSFGYSRTQPPATIPKPEVMELRQKPAVKIGSLPRLGAWIVHLLLAIGAAVLVHLAIYFYGR